MIEITLPWPSPDLSPNARIHWAAKARAVKAARYCAKMLTLGMVLPAGKSQGKLPFRLEFHPPSRRKFDTDNLVARCKAYQDGIADALAVNDNLFEMQKPVVGEVVQGGAVIVRIGE